MNSFLISSKFFALALVFVFSGCTSDQVDPVQSGSSKGGTPILVGEAPVFPVVSPECSPRIEFPLMDELGGLDVNYFGSSGGNPIPWGSATLLNSDEEFVVEIDLAVGWYVEHAGVIVGLESEIVTQGGIPQVGEQWLQVDVNPLVNATQLRIGLPLEPEDCFSHAVGLSIVRYDFVAGVDENSRTQVWVGNPSWDDPLQSEMNTVSFAVGKWCPGSCGN